MTTLLTPSFSTPAARLRERMADTFEALARLVRGNQLEYPPEAWLLFLVQPDAPAGFEVLCDGLNNTAEVDRIAMALHVYSDSLRVSQGLPAIHADGLKSSHSPLKMRQ